MWRGWISANIIAKEFDKASEDFESFKKKCPFSSEANRHYFIGQINWMVRNYQGENFYAEHKGLLDSVEPCLISGIGNTEEYVEFLSLEKVQGTPEKLHELQRSILREKINQKEKDCNTEKDVELLQPLYVRLGECYLEAIDQMTLSNAESLYMKLTDDIYNTQMGFAEKIALCQAFLLKANSFEGAFEKSPADLILEVYFDLIKKMPEGSEDYTKLTDELRTLVQNLEGPVKNKVNQWLEKNRFQALLEQQKRQSLKLDQLEEQADRIERQLGLN